MKILVGVTGSIAAIKVPELIHKMVLFGHSVTVIVTQDALKFVTPIAISSMGVDVFTDDGVDSHNYDSIMEHINLARWADYIIIVPASANTLAKLAYGFADNLLTATLLASNSPKIVVPAMNQQMWKSPATTKNVNCLLDLGFSIWGPAHGLQACGDVDVGRMIEIDEILGKIEALQLDTQKLSGKKIVITLGGTIEYLDPARYITNRSSGKMGYALAKVAVSLGADVVLIRGRVDYSVELNIVNLHGMKALHVVESAEEMLHIVSQEVVDADVFISCAAVCDYRPQQISKQKIKSNAQVLNLSLVKNPDIVATIKKNNPSVYTVGFAAETQNLVEYAIGKLKTKNLDLIIANDVSAMVFGSDFNQVIIIDRDLNQLKLERMTKTCVAIQIFDTIVKAGG